VRRTTGRPASAARARKAAPAWTPTPHDTARFVRTAARTAGTALLRIASSVRTSSAHSTRTSTQVVRPGPLACDRPEIGPPVMGPYP